MKILRKNKNLYVKYQQIATFFHCKAFESGQKSYSELATQKTHTLKQIGLAQFFLNLCTKI